MSLLRHLPKTGADRKRNDTMAKDTAVAAATDAVDVAAAEGAGADGGDKNRRRTAGHTRRFA